MNRWLGWINLGGTLGLAGLCVLQWRENRDLNLSGIRQQATNQVQAAQMREQERTLTGLKADLERFRQRRQDFGEQARESGARVSVLERELAQVSAERDRLRVSLGEWTQAVTARDARLAELERQLEAAIQARNEAIQRYNELVARRRSP